LNGWPSYYLEDTVVMSHAHQTQILSLVSEGVFTKFPNLTVSWRNRASPGYRNSCGGSETWRAMRAEIPWVDRAPSEVIRDHIRFTLQPSDAPPIRR